MFYVLDTCSMLDHFRGKRRMASTNPIFILFLLYFPRVLKKKKDKVYHFTVFEIKG